MARTKATPRVYKKRSMPGSGAITAAALNTRIHRILNAGQELKHYSNSSSFSFPASTTTLLTYVNPYAGIAQGTNANQRIGDAIKVERIVITSSWNPSYAGAPLSSDLCCDWRTALIKIPDTSLINTTLTLAPGALAGFVFIGNQSNGLINGHDFKVLSDKKYKYTPTPMSTGFGAPTSGSYKFKNVIHSKKFGANGKKLHYKTGTSYQLEENELIVLGADLPGYLNASVQGSFTLDYTVFYRDA